MKTILSIVKFFTTLFENSQFENSQETDFEKYKEAVKEKMQKWFTKSEFEKYKEYLERMKKTDIIFNGYKKECLAWLLNFHYNIEENTINLLFKSCLHFISYDAENEIITLSIKSHKRSNLLDFNQIFNIKCNSKIATIIKNYEYDEYNDSPFRYLPTHFYFIKKKVFIEQIGIFYYPEDNYEYDYNKNNYFYCSKPLLKVINFEVLYTNSSIPKNVVFEYTFENTQLPDPELTLADLNLNLPDDVKAIVF